MSENSNDPPENKVDKKDRIYKINGILYLAYSVFLYGSLIINGYSGPFTGEIVLMYGAVILHGGFNFLLALIFAIAKAKGALELLLSSIMILLIGGGVCFAVMFA
ncbi:MAG: hypothetical protein ABUK01_01045 [Leptospirales bacterium]